MDNSRKLNDDDSHLLVHKKKRFPFTQQPLATVVLTLRHSINEVMNVP